MLRRCLLLATAIAFATAAPLSNTCRAAEIYVDNLSGNDAYDGTTDVPAGETIGPFRTIARAVRRARMGDMIILKNNKVPYYDSIELTGGQYGANALGHVTIVGNGAVIDGSSEVPPEAWREVDNHLWKMTPFRKGHYLLMLDGKVVPEVAIPRNAAALPGIPVGKWGAWRGSMYFRSGLAERVPLKSFRFAQRTAGVSLYAVDHVRIVDVTFQHFRLDGINVHDRCNDILLDNVTLVENGRAGLFVGGSSFVEAHACTFDRNREAQVLLRELGAVKLEQCRISQEPVYIP